MTVFKKTMFSLGLTSLIFCAVLAVFSLVFMNSLYHEINMSGLKNTANTLIAAIGKERITEIFTTASSEPSSKIDLPVKEDSVYRLTLIDSSGHVLWDSHVTDDLVNHLDRQEIVDALEGREGIAKRESVSTRMSRIYFALPVFEESGNLVGVFRLSCAVPGFKIRISPVIPPFIIFMCFFLAAAFFAIFSFSRYLSTSFGRLVSIAQIGAPLLSGPEADEPVSLEFDSLEKALRAMTQELNVRFKQAKAESRRLEAILNGMSEAVFAMDSSLKLHLLNPKAREIFNIGVRDINGMSLLEATRSTELERAAKKAISGGTSLEMEMTFHTGAEMCFQVFATPLSGVPLSGAETNVVINSGVVIVLQDITRLVKLERVRKDFVANVSHELRTPIQLIKGFSETLLDLVGDSDKGEKKQMNHFVKIIKKNADNMENLTNDLLILADLENNARLEREMEKVSVSSLIEEAVSSVEPQAKRKQIEIIINCSKDLSAKLYGSFIIRALINLIDNGVKYSPNKSKIWVSANIESEELLLEVRDKGIGIPAEHLQRIFERFYRVDRARSREAGGTGLGLSIVRHIALLHKGKVEAESHVPEGSIFRIRIPAVSS